MRVYVFGLGHIGLPMATWFALRGYKVTGIDINPEVIKKIKTGTVKIEEYYQGQHISQCALRLIEANSLCVSTQFAREDFEPSIFVIAVGIAEKTHREQDLTPILSLLETISPHLVANDLVLFRTTLIPGTIDQLIVLRLHNLNQSIRLAYCPETIMETRAFEELEKNAMILSGIDNESVERAEAFLKSLSNAPIYKASNIKTAEMVKVIQNIHRDVNIALVNEISEVAYQLGVDIYELISLVNTHPRVTLLQPGPGVGGYCLPNALSYLEKAVDSRTSSLTLMSIARKLNEERPLVIVQLINEILRKAGKTLSSSKVALVGLAMKDFCADCRNSPALDVAAQLIKSGARVQAYDPLVKVTQEFQVESLEEALIDADCLVILADQKDVTFSRGQLEALMAKPILVVDTRNVFPNYKGIQVHRP